MFSELVAGTPETADFNKRCSNRRMCDELQMELLYPTINTGLPQAIRATIPQ